VSDVRRYLRPHFAAGKSTWLPQRICPTWSWARRDPGQQATGTHTHCSNEGHNNPMQWKGVIPEQERGPNFASLAHTYKCTHTHAHARICTHAHTCTHAHNHTHTYIHTHARKRTHAHTTRTHARTHTRTHTHARTHAHTHTHAHVCTCTHRITIGACFTPG
jgi:hypothetical protein